MAEMKLNIEGIKNSGNTISSGVATIMSGVASLSGLPCPRGLTSYGSIAAAAGQITMTATNIGNTKGWINSVVEKFKNIENLNNSIINNTIKLNGNVLLSQEEINRIAAEEVNKTLKEKYNIDLKNRTNKTKGNAPLSQEEINRIAAEEVNKTFKEKYNIDLKNKISKSKDNVLITDKIIAEVITSAYVDAIKSKDTSDEWSKTFVENIGKNIENLKENLKEKSNKKTPNTSKVLLEDQLKAEMIGSAIIDMINNANSDNKTTSNTSKVLLEDQLKSEMIGSAIIDMINNANSGNKTTSNTSKVLLEDQLKSEMIGSAIIDMINNANSGNKTTSNTSKVLLEDQLKSEMIGSAIIDIINNANSSNKSTPKEEVKIDSKKENKTTIKKSEKTTNISSFYDKTEESHSSKNEEYKLEKENVFGKLEDEISRISISFENTIKDEKNKDTLINKFKDYINTTIEVVYESMSEFKNEDMDFAKTVMAGVAEQLSIKDNTLIKAGNDEAFKKIVINKEIIRVLVKDKALGKQINERLKLITIDEIENLKKNVQKENQEQAEKLIKELTSGLKYIETADKKNLSAEFQQLVEKVIKEQ